jgi:nitrate/nitrite transport system permease protein
MKYKITKFLDVTGLGVLEPVVLLLWGEEPRVQLRKIGLFIVVPILVFCLFLAAWGYVGPRHKTKSGEVPTPGVVIEAYRGIVEFHDREYTKLDDFAREDADRTAELERVKAREQEVSLQSTEATKRFSEIESRFAATLESELSADAGTVARQETRYQEQEAEYAARIRSWGDTIATDDTAAKEKFLTAVGLFLEEKETNREHLKALRSELDEKRRKVSPELEALRKRKNALDQEAQFLKKRLAYLTQGNRSVRAANASRDLALKLETFTSASGGGDLLELATGIVHQKRRIDKVRTSTYAKPPTFFDQIVTSVECVFLGFVIASLIAIPLGVLCGLSPVFMASMMPLISLFKPVSPIVWLPIVFIIVGGFITTPEDAWIPPAFLSSAVTVALCCLWPTLVNTALGVASIQQDHMNVARMLRLGFWSRLFKIVIPSALPLIFAGLRISLGVGWMVLIAGELLSSSPGLGKFVWDMFNNGSSETFAQMFVVVFVVGGIGFLLDRVMIVLQRSVSFDGVASAL